jgi:hypothetical protein
MSEQDDMEAKDAVISKLSEYERRFTEIMNMVADKPPQGDEKLRAQELLKELKASLKADLKDLDARRDELNHYEKAFLDPALREASADMKTAVNTVPDGRWHSDLYGARMDITHLLRQLDPSPDPDESQGEQS